MLKGLWNSVTLAPEDATGAAAVVVAEPAKTAEEVSRDTNVAETPEAKAAAEAAAKKTADEVAAKADTPEAKAAAEKAEKDFTDARAKRGLDDYGEFKFPEGIKPDTEGLKELAPIAKKLGLNKAETQELIDLQVKRAQAEAKQTEADWTTLRKNWQDEAKADKTFGGDNFTENTAKAKATMAALDKDLLPTLEALGVNDNPVIFRVFAGLSKRLGDDKLGLGGGAAPTTKKPGEILYDHPTSRNT